MYTIIEEFMAFPDTVPVEMQGLYISVGALVSGGVLTYLFIKMLFGILGGKKW